MLTITRQVWGHFKHLKLYEINVTNLGTFTVRELKSTRSVSIWRVYSNVET